MRTIKEEIRHCIECLKYLSNYPPYEPESVEHGFIKGVAFAEEWISVEDELPTICIEASEENILLLRNKIDGGITLGYRKIDYWHSQLGILTFGTVTHWRPINRK